MFSRQLLIRMQNPEELLEPNYNSFINNQNIPKLISSPQNEKNNNISYNNINNINNPNNNKINEEIQKNKKINMVLEDICIYGTVTKNQIKEEKSQKEKNEKNIIEKSFEIKEQFEKDENKETPIKYIETNLALEKEEEDPGIFALGLISDILEKNNIDTIIEIGEDNQNKINNEEEVITSLQFLTNGLIGKKKYELVFDLPDERCEELLLNSNEFEKFKEILLFKISSDYNIPKEKIIITFPQKGSLIVQLIFQSGDFNDLDIQEFILKFKNDPNFPELRLLKTVHSGLLMPACRLSKYQLDPLGNRFDGWGMNEKRGGEEYDPPVGWIGIGLKVFGVYSNDRWMDMQNLEGEWVVAYHGVGNGLKGDKVLGISGNIIGMGFKAGRRQLHKNCEDQFHPGQKVGEGVYVTPLIKIAEEYTGECKFKGKKYKVVIMSRVNPRARRHCHEHPDSIDYKYWVVNGTTDEIRPYRILFKKC